MSRLLAAIFLAALISPENLYAQQMSDAQVSAMIEKQRRQVALDADGCQKYPDDEDENVIIVCGEDPENRKQRMPSTEYDPDKIRAGQAVSTKRAGECIGEYPKCRHRLHEVYGAGFGYVKPMAIDHDEVMKGLPDADMVVAEGTSEKERLAAEAEKAEAVSPSPE